MMDRLFNEAKYLAENNQYKEANELFEQALLLGEGDEVSLSIFAYSLYEEKITNEQNKFVRNCLR